MKLDEDEDHILNDLMVLEKCLIWRVAIQQAEWCAQDRDKLNMESIWKMKVSSTDKQLAEAMMDQPCSDIDGYGRVLLRRQDFGMHLMNFVEVL